MGRLSGAGPLKMKKQEKNTALKSHWASPFEFGLQCRSVNRGKDRNILRKNLVLQWGRSQNACRRLWQPSILDLNALFHGCKGKVDFTGASFGVCFWIPEVYTVISNVDKSLSKIKSQKTKLKGSFIQKDLFGRLQKRILTVQSHV